MEILKTNLKTAPKTNLVQSLEEIQEVNETLAIIESYIRYVNSSTAVPNYMLKGGSGNYLSMFQEKPAKIKIDVTKY